MSHILERCVSKKDYLEIRCAHSFTRSLTPELARKWIINVLVYKTISKKNIESTTTPGLTLKFRVLLVIATTGRQTPPPPTFSPDLLPSIPPRGRKRRLCRCSFFCREDKSDVARLQRHLEPNKRTPSQKNEEQRTFAPEKELAAVSTTNTTATIFRSNTVSRSLPPPTHHRRVTLFFALWAKMRENSPFPPPSHYGPK